MMSEQTHVIVLGNGLHAIPTLSILSGNTLGALCAVATMSSAGISSPISITFIVATYLLAYPLLIAANWLYLREARSQALTVVQSGLFAAMCVLTMWTVDFAAYKAFSGAALAPQKLAGGPLPVPSQGFTSPAVASQHDPKAPGSTHYRKNVELPLPIAPGAARTARSDP